MSFCRNFCFVIFLLSLNAVAQEFSVKGKILEKNLPVEMASVYLYTPRDSVKAIQSTLSDSSGNFSFANLNITPSFIRIQMIGYLPQKIMVDTSGGSSIVLPEILLQPDSKILNAVDIVMHKEMVKKTPQGFIIQAKDNITQAGGTATDLLKNAPTVMVDAEGNISIRGKSPLILINGRNSSLGSTDRIPASSVESIEIINNPSAQYDADADGGIINITLKKNKAQGTNVSLGLGGGLGAKGRVNSSFIINHQSGKWNLGLAYDNRFAGRTRQATADRTDFNLPDEYALSQHRFDNRLEQTQNLRMNIDFAANKKNQFGFELIGNIDGQDNDETLVSMIENQANAFMSKNSRRSIEIAREKVAEIAFNFNRKFDKARKSFSMNLSSSFNNEKENTDINTQSLTQNDNDVGEPLLQRTHNYQNSSVSNFRVDFSHPLFKRGTIETGYKGILRLTNADLQSLYLESNAYVLNPLASNLFNFQEQIHAAYLQFRSSAGSRQQWQYDAGIRLEQVFNHGEGVSNNLSVTRQYFNYFPTANLRYQFNQNNYLKASFSRRINRPGLGQLNPFIDITDSLNQHSGNPYLKPELVNSAEMGYNGSAKKISYSVLGFYRYATNIIRPYILLKDNGVALTLPMNYGNSETYGVEGIFSVFPFKFWSFNASYSLYRQYINGSNVSADLSNDVIAWYGKIINNFTLWKGSKLQVTGNYTSPVPTPQGTRIAVYNVDVGFQQKIFGNRGGLGLIVTDLFNTQKSGVNAYSSDFEYHRTFKVDTRAVLITFAYSFGTSFKEEMMENKFSND